VVSAQAEIADGVVIGPLCYVGPEVVIGAETVLHSHVSLSGPTRLGARNQLFPFAVIGSNAQDRSYSGEHTELIVGDDNQFREHVTIHRGTSKGGGVTRIGSHCLLMVGAHVAHDCVVGDRVIVTNQSSLGGHVQVRQGALIGGHAAVAPFVRIGRLSFVAGGAMVEANVPPFVIVQGDRARVRALNKVGLRRSGMSSDEQALLAQAFGEVWRSAQPLSVAWQSLPEALRGHPLVAEWEPFISGSK
jgi:UDP-N-acetylglucosamine acyltransferase